MSEDNLQELPKTDPKPIKGGRMRAGVEMRSKLRNKRFVFTVAQNNTKLHEEFWQTLTRFAKRRKARLIVGKLSYNKNGWQKVTTESEGVWYDPRIEPFVLDEQAKIAERLVWCGELDILPTAVYPLNGLDNYTGHNSAIIPHTKMQMRSLATMKHEPAKLLYTTGAVTLRNYIQRRAGQLAEYHHVYGALYVEIDKAGNWFVRQLNADEDGIMYDLNTVYGPTWERPAREFGRPVLTLGDIHLEKLDKDAFTGALDMIGALNPSDVFIHDLIDFQGRNHHNINDTHFLVQMQAFRKDRVEDMIRGTAKFLYGLCSAFPETTFNVVKSNHDEAFDRWVKSRPVFTDPVNARYWHECNAIQLRYIESGTPFDVFAWAVYRAGHEQGFKLSDLRLRFVQEDESVLINGIEYGMHGHLGPNGARGNPKNFRQIGRRVNHGHTHSAGIIDGVWTAGVLGSLDMGYNRGPSSWSHSSILTYPNAKRTIITQHGKEWRV